MWEKVFISIICIAIVVMSVVIVYRLRGKKHCIWYSCGLMLLCFIGIIRFAHSNPSKIFPTIESVVDYVCPNTLLGVVEGDASDLIVYKENSSEINYIIALKSSDGYSIDKTDTHSFSKWGSTQGDNQDSFYSIILLECTQTGEQYVLIFGHSYTVDMSILAISDSMNSEFVITSGQTILPGDRIVSHGYAFATLNGNCPEAYEISIVNSNGKAHAVLS